ncbi:MAG TPA: alpha/beta hydrolase [Elusimicrobia bacterium]|nr:MAG: hypothetical protein A2089_11225 [Elusimicrobia bacterium GWD2_63_28]HCC48617.1 alpha/beta hydrolase [Elusimicrobiota bacterium]
MRLKLLFLCAALPLSGCTHLFFKPTRHIHADPAAHQIKFEAIKFNSADGTALTGLFFPPEGAPKGTVVHFHGNGQNMTAHYPYASWLAGAGYNVFVFDYRGYGASGGKPSLQGVVEDGKAALAQALKLPGAEPGKIVIFGQSLGGAIAAAAIGETGFKPAALVVEGTFYSYRQVAAAVMRQHWLTWPFSWLAYLTVSGSHSPSDYIAAIDCPKVFIHAVNDNTVPFAQGKKIYAAASGPKEFWEVPAGHIEAFSAFHRAYAPRLLTFLDESLK